MLSPGLLRHMSACNIGKVSRQDHLCIGANIKPVIIIKQMTACLRGLAFCWNETA